ncbi:hypothetical protein KVR01_005212 [Diaporthe batatas]|uniref:uncharacterized protein n=1 Tax=Diaporthe batatas TaxID=748121 RepID=UPI001D058F29|nr:uncharacterized protein KVR01_005212 [Diaporthe batatas]KAG8164937.1 hypothetical protein KVR01_005212 [Diaporthe batatas]
MAEHSWPVRRVLLHPPPLEEVAAAVRNGLASNFGTSSASVSHPPDLRHPPFHLAGRGLSGNPRVADIGGQRNLFPEIDLDKRYDLLRLSGQMEMAGGVLIGAGAGPFFDLGRNIELAPNIAFGSAADGELRNCTRYAKVLDDGGALCEKIVTSTGCALMCNLFGCDGEAGPLLHIKGKGRTGKLNFTEAIQKGLADVYGDRLISVGGVFVVRSGRLKMHVMPDFPEKAFTSRQDVDRWLHWYDMDTPMVCLSVLHSGHDKDLGLRKEHTHCFGADGAEDNRRGGHYHFDLDETMESVEYEGWFNVAEILYKID